MDTNELRRQRAKLIADARAVLDAADGESRALTAEEEQTYDKHMEEAGKLETRIKREEELQAEERRLAESQDHGNRPDPNEGNPENRATHPRATEEYQAAFRSWLRGGERALTAEEYRALQADDDVAGGYTIPPQQFVTDLIKAVDDLVFIRGLATVQTLEQAESLGVPSLDADPADADWTTELATGSADTAMAFGKRELRPHPLAKTILVSKTLLRRSPLDTEGLVRDRLAYKFAITEEKAFLSGSGAQQPLGLFTASADGISTGQDVSTGNTTTSIQTDGLQEAKWTLKPQYRMRARWLFHTDALKQIAKLKDGDGQYIWQQGLQAGAPDRLLNLPYIESLYVPNTFTTGLYVGMLGDFSKYWIVDALDMTIQRLVELKAETNQDEFIGRLEADGMPVLEEAFVRVTLA